MDSFEETSREEGEERRQKKEKQKAQQQTSEENRSKTGQINKETKHSKTKMNTAYEARTENNSRSNKKLKRAAMKNQYTMSRIP